MTAIALQPVFDPIAEMRAILDSFLTWESTPKAESTPKPTKAKRKSSARDFGMGRVSYRKTPCGFMEPVVTMPNLANVGRVNSLADYHALLMKRGCVPVGGEGNVTVYRTPEGTELRVKSNEAPVETAEPKVSYCHGMKP